MLKILVKSNDHILQLLEETEVKFWCAKICLLEIKTNVVNFRHSQSIKT